MASLCNIVLALLLLNVVLLVFSEARSLSFAFGDAQTRDRSTMLGHDVVLNAIEDKANRHFMHKKTTELEQYYNTSDFPPAADFLASRRLIEASDVFQFLRKMPKGGVLHLHFAAAVPPEFVVGNISYRSGLYMCQDEVVRFRFAKKPETIERLPKCANGWKVVAEMRSHMSKDELQKFDRDMVGMLTLDRRSPDIWQRFEGIFDKLSALQRYLPHFRDVVEEIFKAAVADKVMYLEFRGIPTLYDDEGKYPKDKALTIMNSVLDTFRLKVPDFYGFKVIMTSSKSSADKYISQALQETIQLAKIHPLLVIGFDLHGQEDVSPPLKSHWKLLSQTNLNYYFHAGETSWNGFTGDKNLLTSLMLNTKRLGHALSLIKHPYLMSLVQSNDVAIEVSPVSNNVLGYVPDLRNHPAASLMARDSIPIVVSSDDPFLWGATILSHDFYETIMALAPAISGLPLLKKLALNSFKYSGLTQKELLTVWPMWERQWDEFVRQF